MGWKYPSGLYGMQPDGSDVRQLIKADVMMEARKVGSFSPSPDGHRLAVHVYRENADRKPDEDFIESNAIFIVDLVDLSASKLVDNALSPVWSPNGEKLAYLSDELQDHNIYIYNFTTDSISVIDGTITGYERTLLNSVGDWSPDSQKLALTVWVIEPYLDLSHYTSLTIFVLDLEKRELSRVLPKGQAVGSTTWGTSNHEIYYDGFNFGNSFLGIWKLDLQSLTDEEVLNFGTSLDELKEEGVGWYTQLDINNDGRIIFIGLPRYQDIYLFDPKTKTVTNLTHTDNAREEKPQWWCSSYHR